MVAIEDYEAHFALLHWDRSAEFSVTHIASSVLRRLDTRLGEFSCLPFNINIESAACTKALDATFCPSVGKRREKVDATCVTLQKHFRYARRTAEVTVNLEACRCF